MGYNGGVNKRGYYRRNHGMYSKSSIKSGSRILSNIFLGGLGMMISLGNSLSEDSNSALAVQKTKVKHFNPMDQTKKFIIYGIIAILCPIAGFFLFVYANWWIFFSVLICGFIETVICFSIIPGKTNNYIYTSEVENVKKRCRSNLYILRGLFIILFVLNFYPFLSYDLSNLSFLLVLLKLAISIMIIMMSFNHEINTEEYSHIIPDKNKELL